jgi:hypothetical protein
MAPGRMLLASGTGRAATRGGGPAIELGAERAPVIGAGREPWIEGVPAHVIQVTPSRTSVPLHTTWSHGRLRP